MRPNGNHIQLALLRAVADQAGLCSMDRQKPIMIVETIVSTGWASATFVGARHQLDLRLDGDADSVAGALAALQAGLADREIPIPGHIVAEVNVVAGKHTRIEVNMIKQSLTVNALTIVD